MTGRKFHSRRDFLRAAGLGVAAMALPRAAAPAAPGPVRTLTAAPGRAPIGAPDHASTAVWAYDGTVPGPTLRIRQGETLRLRFHNALGQPSTVHWHGIRIDNAMDGVAGLTQDAVPPGKSFDYVVRAADAGTFWYHPHNRSWEQLARGLYGALVVEEAAPPAVDRDIVLIFDDWRLGQDGEIHEASLGSLHDAAHAGRLGNWLTVNGRSRPAIAVTAGERLRLRLINAANARTLPITLDGHAPHVVALDGQPVKPHRTRGGRVALAPAQRADLIVDMTGDPGARAPFRVLSGRGPGLDVAYLAYGKGRIKREAPLGPPAALPANPLPKRLDLAGALHTDLVMEGGAMGRMQSAMLDGKRLDIRELVGAGKAWAFNGVSGMNDTPLFDVKRGRTATIGMVNDTRWPHAMHLHGHHFRVVERDGRKVADGPWRDTVLMQPGERARIAFVADNPGKWLLHCHMVEHMAAGMVTWIRVTG